MEREREEREREERAPERRKRGGRGRGVEQTSPRAALLGHRAPGTGHSS